MSSIDKLTGVEISKAASLLSPEVRDEDDFYDGHQRVKMDYLKALERRNKTQVEAINLIYDALKALKDRVEGLEEQCSQGQKSASAKTRRTAKARGSSTGTEG